MTKWVELLLAVLSGLIVCVPLVAQLTESVRAAITEKNWTNLLRMVMNYMVEAEETFTVGANKKAYVMSHLKAMAAACNYDLTDESEKKISEMIDAMCAMAEKVN